MKYSILAVVVLMWWWVVTWALINNKHDTSTYVDDTLPTEEKIIEENIEMETISLWHDGRQLVPEVTTLKAWNDYRIEILPWAHGKWCMSTIKLPWVEELPKPIIAGEKIVYALNNPQPWTYTFVCNGMGMRQGDIVVEA